MKTKIRYETVLRLSVWEPSVGECVEGVLTDEQVTRPHWRQQAASPDFSLRDAMKHSERSACAIRLDDGSMLLIDHASTSLGGFKCVLLGERVRFTCLSIGRGHSFDAQEVVPKYRLEIGKKETW